MIAVIAVIAVIALRKSTQKRAAKSATTGTAWRPQKSAFEGMRLNPSNFNKHLKLGTKCRQSGIRVENPIPMPHATHSPPARAKPLLVCVLEEIEPDILERMIPPECVPMLLAVSGSVRDGLRGLPAHVHARADERLRPMPVLLRSCVVRQMIVRRQRLKHCEALVLADILARCSKLQHLELRLDALTESAAQVLWLAAKHCGSLESFALGCMHTTSVSKTLLLTACRDLENLARLNLHGLKIGTEGAQTLATCLHTSGKLRHLDLGKNYVNDEGLAALASRLCASTSLQHLDLQENRLTEQGMRCWLVPRSSRIWTSAQTSWETRGRPSSGTASTRCHTSRTSRPATCLWTSAESSS